MNRQKAEIADITMELDIEAPPAKVWQSLTEKIGDWWPAEFFAGGEAGQRQFTLEVRPGGRMFEQWDNGGGVLWGTVVSADPGVMLQVLGVTFPAWGGPQQWYGTWELESRGDGTRLKFSESTLGRISDANIADKDKGWSFLWQTLKAYAEDRDPPRWQD